jgi:SlyX protein
MDRLDLLEETVAHLTRAVEDLSDVLARREAEVDRLSRLVALLVEREALREAQGLGSAEADVKPPHW